MDLEIDTLHVHIHTRRRETEKQNKVKQKRHDEDEKTSSSIAAQYSNDTPLAVLLKNQEGHRIYSAAHAREATQAPRWSVSAYD